MTQDPGPKTAEQIIKNLHNFNRKERDHLMKFALSEDPTRPFLSKGLWKALRQAGCELQPNPEDMFVGMDYHLNWLFAALVVPDAYESDGIDRLHNTWSGFPGKQGGSQPRPIQNNQQDVDLLIAMPHGKRNLHLYLIEAKLDSGWTSKQFLRKVKRLDAIREAAIQRKPSLQVHWNFLLASPKEPKRKAFSPENLSELPEWISAKWSSAHHKHVQFGPEKVYRVKRESSKGWHWQVKKFKLS